MVVVGISTEFTGVGRSHGARLWMRNTGGAQAAAGIARVGFWAAWKSGATLYGGEGRRRNDEEDERKLVVTRPVPRARAVHPTPKVAVAWTRLPQEQKETIRTCNKQRKTATRIVSCHRQRRIIIHRKDTENMRIKRPEVLIRVSWWQAIENSKSRKYRIVSKLDVTGDFIVD